MHIFASAVVLLTSELTSAVECNKQGILAGAADSMGEPALLHHAIEHQSGWMQVLLAGIYTVQQEVGCTGVQEARDAIIKSLNDKGSPASAFLLSWAAASSAAFAAVWLRCITTTSVDPANMYMHIQSRSICSCCAETDAKRTPEAKIRWDDALQALLPAL